jgi:hypothetical protein
MEEVEPVIAMPEEEADVGRNGVYGDFPGHHHRPRGKLVGRGGATVRYVHSDEVIPPGVSDKVHGGLGCQTVTV